MPADRKKKTKVNSESKGVYFNLDKPMDKILYDYVTGDKVVNYSAFMKGLIYNHIQQTGGVIEQPYQQMMEQPVHVSVAKAELPKASKQEKSVYTPEQSYDFADELPEQEEELPAEEPAEEELVEEESNSSRAALAKNFGRSARNKRN